MNIEFLVGNIIDVPAEGLVCSGNVYLNMSGGVNGELYSRGAAGMQKQLYDYLKNEGIRFVQPGFVMEIGPGKFDFACIVYSVAIDCWYESSIELVSATLRRALEIIEQKGCTTVNIPALATGYGRLKKTDFGKAVRSVLQEKAWKFTRVNVVEQLEAGLAEIRDGYRMLAQAEKGLNQVYEPQDLEAGLPDENFTYFKFKDEILQQYNLPDQPCPVRIAILEKVLAGDGVELSLLADECHLYLQNNPQDKKTYVQLYTRLCFISGVVAGQSENDVRAAEYFSRAYRAAPLNLEIAGMYAFTLGRLELVKDALAVYDSVISTLGIDGEHGYSTQFWWSALSLHLQQDNYIRAHELLGTCLWLSPESFDERIKSVAKHLEKKSQQQRERRERDDDFLKTFSFD